MSDDFERRVREKVEQISQSKEVKNAAKEFQNAAKDFKNMAEDMKREFSSYQNGKNFHSQQKKDTQNRQDFYRDSREKYHVGQQTQRPNDYHGTKSGQNTTVTLPDEKKYKTFSVAGTLFTVFGGIGLGIFVLFLLIASWLTALMDLFGAPFAILGSVLAILIAVSGIMLGRGIYLLKRTSRLKKYLKIVGKGQFCPIDLLVKESGRDKNFVLKDLNKMIRKKVLPGAHIDDEKTCLMLTDDIYNQYRYVQKQAEERRKEEERLKKEREKERKQQEEALAGNPELAATIRQGREMIEQIRKANDEIEGEEISEKMFRLEKITGQIFEQIQEHPEKLPDVRRLMNYYLPTTLKLLSSYEDFEKQPIQGENIKNAKQQIERSLDTVNLAFENLLDQLFSDEALDVSSDISVLETMLKQEGLTGSEFGDKK